jgi:ribosomal protein S6
MELVCNIEIIKAGIYFVVRVHLPNGSIKEYRHHVFEDVLTEMVIDLQEELSE